MIARKAYMDELDKWRGKDVVKIITGIRCSGKTTLLKMYQEHLRSIGVPDEDIHYINMDSADAIGVYDSRTLLMHFAGKLQRKRLNYVFIDEVQYVPDFHKAIAALFAMKVCDIYISGSDSSVLGHSQEELLSGNIVEIKFFPLSFGEYASDYPDTSPVQLFKKYITGSSLPVASMPDPYGVERYLPAVYDSIMMRGALRRHPMIDMPLLSAVAREIFGSLGKRLPARVIAAQLSSSGREIGSDMVSACIQSLLESYVFCHIGRYDLRAGKYLPAGGKYYASDAGLCSSVPGTKKNDIGALMENAVCMELLRRGYEVRIGELGAETIDFVAAGSEGISCFQVARTVVNDAAAMRDKLSPLSKLPDYVPKYMLTLDFTPMAFYDFYIRHGKKSMQIEAPPVSDSGIRMMNVIDWILGIGDETA